MNDPAGELAIPENPRATAASLITEEHQENSAAWSRRRRELFAAERELVVDLRDEGKISAEVMRRVERY